MAKDALHRSRCSWHTVHRIDKWAQTFKLIIVNGGVADAASMYACSVQRRGTGWATKVEGVDFVGLGT